MSGISDLVSKIGTAIDYVAPGSPAAWAGGMLTGKGSGTLSETINGIQAPISAEQGILAPTMPTINTSPVYLPTAQFVNPNTTQSADITAGVNGLTGQSGPSAAQMGFFQNSLKNIIPQSAVDNIGNTGLQWNAMARNNLSDWQSQQQSLDNQGIQNALAQQQGQAGILGMVGSGIRSGNAMLSNRNAADSSASEAIARAYGNLGQRQMGDVGNQYSLAENARRQSQLQLQKGIEDTIANFGADKQLTLNQIMGDVRSKLWDLDTQMANAGVTQRLDIEQEKEGIRQLVLQELQKYDQLMSNTAGQVNPMGMSGIQSQAADLGQQGRAATTPFNVNSLPGAQLQGSQAIEDSQLPIYTPYRNKEQL